MTAPAPQASATFTFGEDPDSKHLVGDPECGECWSRYPRPCERDGGCAGLVHANFGDENYDGDYWLYTRCDVCGESESR